MSKADNIIFASLRFWSNFKLMLEFNAEHSDGKAPGVHTLGTCHRNYDAATGLWKEPCPHAAECIKRNSGGGADTYKLTWFPPFCAYIHRMAKTYKLPYEGLYGMVLTGSWAHTKDIEEITKLRESDPNNTKSLDQSNITADDISHYTKLVAAFDRSIVNEEGKGTEAGDEGSSSASSEKVTEQVSKAVEPLRKRTRK